MVILSIILVHIDILCFHRNSFLIFIYLHTAVGDVNLFPVRFRPSFYVITSYVIDSRETILWLSTKRILHPAVIREREKKNYTVVLVMNGPIKNAVVRKEHSSRYDRLMVSHF